MRQAAPSLMKKVALVFVVAVIAPSLVLAWLAARSMRDQETVRERQELRLAQGVADELARGMDQRLTELRRDFNERVESLLGEGSPRAVTETFDTRLREAWPLAEVGFVVTLDQQVLAPSLFAGPEARQFRLENERFLCSHELARVYWSRPAASAGAVVKAKTVLGEAPINASNLFKAPAPMNAPASEKQSTPALTAEEAEFRQVVTSTSDGALARFLQNRLTLLFWHRPSRDPQLVFGAQINMEKLVNELRTVMLPDPAGPAGLAAALLDDTGRPVALSKPGFTADWKRPFAASEIGGALPHWKVAVHRLNPHGAGRAAATARLAVGLLVTLLVLAIGVGSWLIVADLRRQLALARQKTDFVSNVSHELKTPLTSIRLFSEMLAEGRVEDEARRRQFLGIITAETARLTRLINNVLDFARHERGERQYQFAPCDLAALARRTVESYRPHLESIGFRLDLECPAGPMPVRADADALAQVLLNLLSNAEKYSGERRDVTVRVALDNDAARVEVLDHGPGVPRGCEEKIFEEFFRAHDSLSSGIPGSGLGLALARRLARAHGGDVSYAPRPKGGSCFALAVPLSREAGVRSDT
jgi:signal transduction histidine kinase